MDWYKFILKIKPNGKAFRSLSYTRIFFETLAYSFNLIKEYAVFEINDQVWYVNDNFNPEPWEQRYGIEVAPFSTLEQRREVVKSYMLYPQSENRLSIDYLQLQLDNAGYSDVIISTNEAEDTGIYLHGNNVTLNEQYNVGPDAYNSIILNGSSQSNAFFNMLILMMSIKPLDTAVYDNVEVLLTVAYDDTLAISIAFDEYYFKSKFGSNGSGNGQFSIPTGIAVDSTNIYVVDQNNARVQIFDLAGVFVSKFGVLGTGDGEFQSPYAIAVDSTNIYVVDGGRNNVQIFDLAGVFVSKFGSNGSGDGQFSIPTGIAVNLTNIYVVDQNNARVQIFDLAGVFVSKFGVLGTGDGEFQSPTGIAVNSTNIFVIDAGRNNVQIFDLAGVFVSKFGSNGSGDGQFSIPTGIAVNLTNIYVVDQNNARVQIFDLAGVFVSKFGVLGTGDGEFQSPYDIAVYSTNTYVVDGGLNNVQEFYNNVAIALTTL